MTAFHTSTAIFLLSAVLLASHVSAAPAAVAEGDLAQSQALDFPTEAGANRCYYNFQHYEEGDRIITNEPCLNCTCHKRMLMCYLRVCPFTKPVGQDCIVEKKPDQCCPVITCPQVPVDVLTSSTTTESSDSTALGQLSNYGCTLEDNTFYPDGVQMPSDPKKPCELCYCIRNHTACVRQECTLNVEGCRPVHQEGVCCPVRYDCDYNEIGTTERPSTGGLLLGTSPSPLQCMYGETLYNDGELIVTEKPCESCYCMRGDIVCAVRSCGEPLEGKDCEALPPPPGECCPTTYQCANGTISIDSLSTESSIIMHPAEMETQEPSHAPVVAAADEEAEKVDEPTVDNVEEEPTVDQVDKDEEPAASSEAPVEPEAAVESETPKEEENKPEPEKEVEAHVESDPVDADELDEDEALSAAHPDESLDVHLVTETPAPVESDNLVTSAPSKPVASAEEEGNDAEKNSDGESTVVSEESATQSVGEEANQSTASENVQSESSQEETKPESQDSEIANQETTEGTPEVHQDSVPEHSEHQEESDNEASDHSNDAQTGVETDSGVTSNTEVPSPTNEEEKVDSENGEDKLGNGSNAEEQQPSEDTKPSNEVSSDSQEEEKPEEPIPATASANTEESTTNKVEQSEVETTNENLEVQESTNPTIAETPQTLDQVKESETENESSEPAHDAVEEDNLTQAGEAEEPSQAAGESEKPIENETVVREPVPPRKDDDGILEEHEQVAQHPEGSMTKAEDSIQVVNQPVTEIAEKLEVTESNEEIATEGNLPVTNEAVKPEEDGVKPESDDVKPEGAKPENDEITENAHEEEISEPHEEVEYVQTEQPAQENASENQEQPQEQSGEHPESAAEAVSNDEVESEATTDSMKPDEHVVNEESTAQPSSEEDMVPSIIVTETDSEKTTDTKDENASEVSHDGASDEDELSPLQTDKPVEEHEEEKDHAVPEVQPNEEQSTASPAQGEESPKPVEASNDSIVDESSTKENEISNEHETESIPVKENEDSLAVTEKVESDDSEPHHSDQAETTSLENEVNPEEPHVQTVDATEPPKNEEENTDSLIKTGSSQPDAEVNKHEEESKPIEAPADNQNTPEADTVETNEFQEVAHDPVESDPTDFEEQQELIHHNPDELSLENEIFDENHLHGGASEYKPMVPMPGPIGVIPGEGDCLVDGKTYTNNSLIPSKSPCHKECTCISSIVHCQGIDCPPPPPQLANCMPVHQGDLCCPVYTCDGNTAEGPESHNQMGIVDGVTTKPDADEAAAEVFGHEQDHEDSPEPSQETESEDIKPAAVTEQPTAEEEIQTVQPAVSENIQTDDAETDPETHEEGGNPAESDAAPAIVSEDGHAEENAEKPDAISSPVEEQVEEHKEEETHSNDVPASDLSSTSESSTEEQKPNEEQTLEGEAQTSLPETNAIEETTSNVAESDGVESETEDKLPAAETEVHGVEPETHLVFDEELPWPTDAPTHQEETTEKAAEIDQSAPETSPAEHDGISHSEPETAEETHSEVSNVDEEVVQATEVPSEHIAEESVDTESSTDSVAPVEHDDTPKPEEDVKPEEEAKPEEEIKPEEELKPEDEKKEVVPASEEDNHLTEDVEVTTGIASDVQTDSPATVEHEHNDVVEQAQDSVTDDDQTTDVEIHGEEGSEQHTDEEVKPQETEEGPASTEKTVEEHSEANEEIKPEQDEIEAVPHSEEVVTESHHEEPVDKPSSESVDENAEAEKEEAPSTDAPQTDESVDVQTVQTPESEESLPSEPSHDETVENAVSEEHDAEHSGNESLPDVSTETTQENVDADNKPEVPAPVESESTEAPQETSPEHTVVSDETEQAQTHDEEVHEAQNESQEPIVESDLTTKGPQISENSISTEGYDEKVQSPESDDLVLSQDTTEKLTVHETDKVDENKDSTEESATSSNQSSNIESQSEGVQDNNAPAQEPTELDANESEEPAEPQVPEQVPISETENTAEVAESEHPEQNENASIMTELPVEESKPTAQETEQPTHDTDAVDAESEKVKPEEVSNETNNAEGSPETVTETIPQEEVKPAEDNAAEIPHVDDHVAEESPDQSNETPAHDEQTEKPAEQTVEAQAEHHQAEVSEAHEEQSQPEVQEPAHQEEAVPETEHQAEPEQPAHEESSHENETPNLSEFPTQPETLPHEEDSKPESNSPIDPELPPEDHFPTGGDMDYDMNEDGAFGPGTCRYGGKVYVSAQQIPRDDPCDFCFCFRSDIICLQQSCPPPIHRCHQEPIQGYCCPRYQCPVSMATSLNLTTTTTTTTTTLPPHFFAHAYQGAARQAGCLHKGRAYSVGEEITSASGPCLQCICGSDGQMKCDPVVCSPEPMLRKMMEAAVSHRRR